jgi:DNA-binding CsgD family transcriptional regulator
MCYSWRRLTSLTRGWPIHRWAALVLVFGLAAPAGAVNVAFGHVWPAGPPVLHALLVIAELVPLWWIVRWPMFALAAAAAFFFATQAYAWTSTTADLSIFAALIAVAARTRPRVAVVCGLMFMVTLAAYMAATQAPGHPEAIGGAILPATIIVALPVLLGMVYRLLRRQERPAPADQYAEPPAPARADFAGGAERGTRAVRLTARELVILGLVAEGLTNTEIAAELTIGRETVKTHVGNIIAKLGARDRTHAVAMAYRDRIIGEG